MKVSNKLILPEIDNKDYYKKSLITNNLSSPKYLKHKKNLNNNINRRKNPINYIRLNPIKKNKFRKSKSEYLDAEEYLEQFYNIPDIYNLNEFNKKLLYLKKILLNKNIFVIKTGWETVWDNISYSFDKAEEIICKRYRDIINERYNLFEHKYNMYKYNYPKKLMTLLYTKELVSFINISDYSIYYGKINGIIKLNINFINNDDKNIIFSCIREIFIDRYKYDESTNTVEIKLRK